MNQSEDRVTRRHILGDHADRQQIIHLVERNFGALDLLVDRIEPLDAPLHARLDAVLPELLRQRVFHGAQELLTVHAPRLHCCRNLFVAQGVGVAERQIFQLAAHLAHAQPVRKGSVDVQRLARDRLLPVGLQVLQRPHIVQPVGQLDQHHAHVRHHGQQHLAHVLCLAVFAIGKLDLVDLGYAFDDVRHLVAELFRNLLGGRFGIFHGVVQ